MFTGIIHDTGTVAELLPGPSGARLTVHLGDDFRADRGESIAVNGVCLTALPLSGGFAADLSPETLTRTTLGNLAHGAAVNLERAMILTDRLGGHLVQGHIDTMGALVEIIEEAPFATYRFSLPLEFTSLVVDKGSIAVDGISLTVVEPDHTSFRVAVIPETLARTNLRLLRPGDPVNLEFDVIAKMVRRMLEPYIGQAR